MARCKDDNCRFKPMEDGETGDRCSYCGSFLLEKLNNIYDFKKLAAEKFDGDECAKYQDAVEAHKSLFQKEYSLNASLYSHISERNETITRLEKELYSLKPLSLKEQLAFQLITSRGFKSEYYESTEEYERDLKIYFGECYDLADAFIKDRSTRYD